MHIGYHPHPYLIWHSICVQMSPFHKDTGNIRLGLSLMAASNLYFIVPKEKTILRLWSLGLWFTHLKGGEESQSRAMETYRKSLHGACSLSGLELMTIIGRDHCSKQAGMLLGQQLRVCILIHKHEAESANWENHKSLKPFILPPMTHLFQ